MSFWGTVTAIFLADEAVAPMRPVESADAVAGAGLRGDRYAAGVGTWSADDRPHGQLTLIESEAIAAVSEETGVPLDAAETRRNLVTQGVPLNHLVGRTFQVGAATLRGVELCEPCTHLERVTGRAVRKPLVHRGGLNAVIIAGGRIVIGDALEPVADPDPGTTPVHPQEEHA